MDIVNEFMLSFWNKAYYCKVKFPDGYSAELKSDVDMTYKQWQEKIKTAWEDHIKPPQEPEPCKCLVCGKEFICPNRNQ